MSRQSKFTREEKIEALKLAARGRSLASVANEYGVHPNTIQKWKERYRTNPIGAFTDETNNSEEAEMRRLKRRNAELEAENEFLKKASAYFAKSLR